MRPLSEQDHYEVLEVRRGATPEEIERAYRLAKSTYVEDSLAGYSVFGHGDVAAIRERIEIAYRTLSDAAARAAYDASLAARAPEEEARAADVDASGEDVAAAADPVTDELEDLDEDDAEFDGARLRRVRLRQGLELDDISRVTKVNPNYLGCLEEERFSELPAAVYVRGFVMNYATCVGLDAQLVARSYMKRYEKSRGAHRRSLFSRR